MQRIMTSYKQLTTYTEIVSAVAVSSTWSTIMIPLEMRCIYLYPYFDKEESVSVFELLMDGFVGKRETDNWLPKARWLFNAVTAWIACIGLLYTIRHCDPLVELDRNTLA